MCHNRCCASIPTWFARSMALAALAAMINLHAAAQTSSSPSPNALASGSPRVSSASESDPLAVFRTVLLREGSRVIDARARLVHDATRNHWLLAIEDPNAIGGERSVTALPCTKLVEMQQIVQSTPGGRVLFEVTGQVFTYRNQNYLLPTHAVVLADEQAIELLSESSSNDESNAVSEADAPSTSPDSSEPKGSVQDQQDAASESAEDLIAELSRAAGPVTRSTTPAGQQSLPDDDELLRTDRRDADYVAAVSASSKINDTLVREHTLITNRRGKFTRDRAGSWVFVFDADASGLADPPMRLLPCLLLERIEDYARRTGNNSPALLSGEVFIYQGQNYLLPTVFRIPHNRTKLSP